MNQPDTALDGRVTVSIAEAAALLGTGEAALRQQIRRRRVPSVRIGGRRMVPADYLRAAAAGLEWSAAAEGSPS